MTLPQLKSNPMSCKIMNLKEAIEVEKEKVIRAKSSRKSLKPIGSVENLKERIRAEQKKQPRQSAPNLMLNGLKNKNAKFEAKMLKPFSVTEMIGQYYTDVLIQAQNELDDKEEVKEGITDVKGKKLLMHPKRYQVKMIDRQEQTKIFKMLKKQRNAMIREKERKAENKANKVGDVDIIDSEDEPERQDA